MATSRQNPLVRAGNYAAPVDTTGMDPEMKATINISGPKRVKAYSPPAVDHVKVASNFLYGIFHGGKHPSAKTPAARDSTPTLSDTAIKYYGK